jgi:hypothetical protein
MREGIARRDEIAVAGVDAEDLAEQGVQALPPTEGVALRTAVPEAEVEHPLRAELHLAAVVADVGVALAEHEPPGRGQRDVGARRGARVLLDPDVAAAVRQVHVEEAAARVVGANAIDSSPRSSPRLIRRRRSRKGAPSSRPSRTTRIVPGCSTANRRWVSPRRGGHVGQRVEPADRGEPHPEAPALPRGGGQAGTARRASAKATASPGSRRTAAASWQAGLPGGRRRTPPY